MSTIEMVHIFTLGNEVVLYF